MSLRGFTPRQRPARTTTNKLLTHNNETIQSHRATATAINLASVSSHPSISLQSRHTHQSRLSLVTPIPSRLNLVTPISCHLNRRTSSYRNTGNPRKLILLDVMTGCSIITEKNKVQDSPLMEPCLVSFCRKDVDFVCVKFMQYKWTIYVTVT